MLEKPVNISYQNEVFLLSGELDFSNVMPLYRNSLSQLAQFSKLQFDFSQLKTSNSVGIALMIEWIKYARANKKSIQFLNIPKDLAAITKAAGVEVLLNVQPHKNL